MKKQVRGDDKQRETDPDDAENGFRRPPAPDVEPGNGVNEHAQREAHVRDAFPFFHGDLSLE